MINKPYLLLLPLLLFFTFSLVSSTVRDNEKIEINSLIGSWEMQEVHWIFADTTYSIIPAQPGLFIFEKKRYAIMWTPIGEPRKPFQNLSKPTDEETIVGFRSVVFNGGTFELTDSTITTTANIAKVPGFEGGQQYYRYQIIDDALKLTMFDETYPDGQKPGWYGKMETLFVMKKAVD